MYPVCKFEHMGESFDPSTAVDAGHPMIVARPDLFTPEPATASKVKPSKKESN